MNVEKEEETMKKQANIRSQINLFYTIGLITLFLILFTSIHEFFHVLAVLLVEAKIHNLSVKYSILGPSFNLKIGYSNTMQIVIISIFGTLMSCLIAIGLSFFSRKKEKYSLSLFSLALIFNEFTYWVLSFVYQFGDAYVLYNHSSYLYLVVFYSFLMLLVALSLSNFISVNKSYF